MSSRRATRLQYDAAPVAILLALSVAGWLVSSHLAWDEMRMGLVTEMDDGSIEGSDATSVAMTFPFFMTSWVAMMVAMMLPAVTPVVLTVFRWLSSRRDARTKTASLVAGYLVVWSSIGIAAYALLQMLQNRLPAGSDGALRVAAVLLIVAGAYQLTPLKDACLRHCRSPLQIVVQHATLLSRGSLGAFRVGWKHGWYCVGCCLSLMLVLLMLGMMNLVWMAAVAAIIFAEKALPRGVLISRAVAVLLIVIGTAGVVAPQTVSALT
jgi:predicted metal-binding membrane protein